MLRISRKQIEALKQATHEDFEQRMVSHLRRCFPKRMRTLDDAGIIDLVRRGMIRAAKYGISSERGLCSYIDIMCTLGEQFDARSEFSWAATFLNTTSIADPNLCAIILLEAVQALSSTGAAKRNR